MKYCPNCGKPLNTYVKAQKGIFASTILYNACFSCHGIIEEIGTIQGKKSK